MPYDNQEQSVAADGLRQLGAELDKLVESGKMTAHDAEALFQERGGTTGPSGYQAPNQPQADTAALNEQSRRSAARSAAYQASRAGNPEGYTKESQDEWDATHPLSDYE